MKEEVKVTNINGVYHARYIVDDKVISEYACNLKEDVRFICGEMLRWQHKLGNVTELTSSARRKQNSKKAKGKVWKIK